MSASKSALLQESALYYTALENMFEELHLENTPGFRCFTKYAVHSSSALRDEQPQQLKVKPPRAQDDCASSSNEWNRRLNEHSDFTTPKRTSCKIRQQNLFAEQFSLASASKPPASHIELSPRSRERKRVLQSYEHLRKRQLRIENSKKPQRASLRV